MSKQAPITKYLEQRRTQWNRNKSFGGQQSSKVNPLSKPLQEKPPVAISTATKNKLGVFQFNGSNHDPTAKHQVISLLSEDEKENAAATRPALRRRETIDLEDPAIQKQDQA